MSIVTNILFVPQSWAEPDVFGRNISAIKLCMGVSLNIGTFDPACGLPLTQMNILNIMNICTKYSTD